MLGELGRRLVVFGGKLSILYLVTTVALYLATTFLFGLIKASDHLADLGYRGWAIIGGVVTILLVVFQRLAAWVYSL